MKNETEAIVYKYKSQGIYHIKIKKDTIFVELKYKDIIVLSFTDYLLNTGNLTEFRRLFKNQQNYFKYGEVV